MPKFLHLPRNGHARISPRPPPPPPPPPRNGRPSIEWHGVVSCICTVQWRSLFKLIGMFNVMRLWTVPLHPSFFTLSFGHGSLCGQLAFGASGGSACSRRPGHTLCHWRHCGRWTCPLLDHQLPSPSSLAWPVACGPAAGLDAWVAHALRGRLLTGRHIDTRQGTARFPWRRLRAGLHQPQGCARAASGIPDSFGKCFNAELSFPGDGVRPWNIRSSQTAATAWTGLSQQCWHVFSQHFRNDKTWWLLFAWRVRNLTSSSTGRSDSSSRMRLTPASATSSIFWCSLSSPLSRPSSFGCSTARAATGWPS